MCSYRRAVRTAIICLSLLLSSIVVAQGNPKESPASAEFKPSTSSGPKPVSFLSQHLRFMSMDGYSRFRYMDKAAGSVTDRDLQYKISTRVQINLVGDGATYIQGRGESGRNFTSSWDYAGPGMNNGYWSFNLKSLFVGQKIGNHLEAQAGSIEYEWGAGTEMTYADNDAWLEGYRLSYAGDGKAWQPNRVSATVGFVGDFAQPNAFARLHRMGEENYFQILIMKKLGKTRNLSAEIDSIQSIRYARGALRWQKLPLIVVDDATIEVITRASDNPSFGWSGSLSKALDRKGRLRAGVFYDDMPQGLFLKGRVTIFQNGDSYKSGKRIGPTFKVVPLRDLEISLFGSDRLDNTPGPRYRAQVQVRYQFAGLLNRALR